MNETVDSVDIRYCIHCGEQMGRELLFTAEGATAIYWECDNPDCPHVKTDD